MGRITIFTLVDCPHCKRTKSALKARNIPYTEISLTTHPDKRKDMLLLADRLTVPQVFFNDRHIGGADDTLALLEEWDNDKNSTPLERYVKEIESIAGPSDPGLAVPTTPPLVEKETPARPYRQGFIELDSGKRKLSALEITSELMSFMPRNDLKYRASIYKDSFTGKQGVAALQEYYHLPSRDYAIKLGRDLQRKQVIHHVTDDHTFGDSGKYFRLQPYHQPNVLNSFLIWTERVDPDVMALLGRLKKHIGNIESNATDDKGLVDYVAARKDKQFIPFEEAACELQGVDMGSMDESTKLAFGINLYNIMIKHAFIKVGIAMSSLSRYSFFDCVSYNIGGDILSFSDLENGVLRANSVPPYHLSAPFSKGDSRLRLALKKVDPRIHFALNCGALSCPPVKKFSAEAVDEELRIVAQAFCEQDGNVGIDEEKGILSLSMLMNWYNADFVGGGMTLSDRILSFLRGEKKKKLERMIKSRCQITVKFMKYDWGTNAKENEVYISCNDLASNESRVSAFFSGIVI